MGLMSLGPVQPVSHFVSEIISSKVQTVSPGGQFLAHHQSVSQSVQSIMYLGARSDSVGEMSQESHGNTRLTGWGLDHGADDGWP